MSTENRDKLSQAFQHLEHFLGDKKFFVGEQPTIADFSILSNIVQAKSAFSSIENIPKLEAWFRRCEELPGFEENLEGGKVVQDAFKSMGLKLAPLE